MRYAIALLLVALIGFGGYWFWPRPAPEPDLSAQPCDSCTARQMDKKRLRDALLKSE